MLTRLPEPDQSESVEVERRLASGDEVGVDLVESGQSLASLASIEFLGLNEGKDSVE